LAVAFYIAGLTGLFSRYFSNYNPRIRYLSDSAYWVYILHQSALIAFAVPMYHCNIPAEAKFMIVCGGTVLVCLWTYDLFVRNTRLGVLLNGRKHARGLPETIANEHTSAS
jgi:glucan biosynthesis protein C